MGDLATHGRSARAGQGACAAWWPGPNYSGGTRRARAGDPRPRTRLVAGGRAEGPGDPAASPPLRVPLLSVAPRVARLPRSARLRPAPRAPAAQGPKSTAA